MAWAIHWYQIPAPRVLVCDLTSCASVLVHLGLCPFCKVQTVLFLWLGRDLGRRNGLKEDNRGPSPSALAPGFPFPCTAGITLNQGNNYRGQG